MLFKKILCPVDFDENSIAALKTAGELARQSEAIVEVLHVIPINIQPADAPVFMEVYSAQERDSQTKLAELARTHLADVKSELKTAIGQPAASIIHAQKAMGADIIVMGTHGRHGIAHFFLGSVAERVVRESPCPVLTIPYCTEVHATSPRA
jgi:nucleotide-binding universal stress UspA family protein